MPLRSTIKEFQVKHDAEEFFWCLCLKTHLQNRMVKPASNDNTSTLTSTDSCNDSINFHFASFDNYLDSSYSEEEDSFASKLIKIYFQLNQVGSLWIVDSPHLTATLTHAETKLLK